jgi:arylsulfatase A-like enzyme
MGVLSIAIAPTMSRAQERPNVVLVVADDLGRADSEVNRADRRPARIPDDHARQTRQSCLSHGRAGRRR